MSTGDRRFEPVDERTMFDGKIFRVTRERFRYPDGDVVEREIVRHRGAVAMVAHDETDLYLIRQPREAIGDPDFLEIPAGRLDQDGESPLEAAKRELAEEIGKGARTWQHLASFYTSPGFTDEQCHLFMATDLYDESADPDENERIEIVEQPLAGLDSAIRDCRDSKTLVGLLWLRAFLRR
jgi:ADP-ribose pyrophosphatase